MVDPEIEVVDTICLGDIKPEEIVWLWPGYIPRGMLTIICGDGGVGKGCLSMDLVARLTQGKPFPLCDNAEEPGAVVLLANAEEDLQHTLVPRLWAAGADLDLVFAPHEDKDLSLPEDIDYIEQMIVQHEAKLLIIDPLMAYLSSTLNSNQDQHIRQALTPLKMIAEKHGVAVLIICHINKSSGASAGNRVGGSAGIRNTARRLFFVGPDPEDASRRVLVLDKGNVGKPPSALLFSIKDTSFIHEGVEYVDLPHIVWHGTTDCTSERLMAPRDASNSAKPSQMERACSFLQKILADGPVPSANVDQGAQQAGISARTLADAKKNLGVQSKKVGSVWLMSLPTEDCNPPQTLAVLQPCSLDYELDFEEECKAARMQGCNTVVEPAVFDDEWGDDFDDLQPISLPQVEEVEW